MNAMCSCKPLHNNSYFSSRHDKYVEKTILTPQMAEGHYKISTTQLLYNVENKEPYPVIHSSISSSSIRKTDIVYVSGGQGGVLIQILSSYESMCLHQN